MADSLHIWTVYDNPSDYPGWFVGRLHLVPGGPTDGIVMGRTLEDVRSLIPEGLTCLPRQGGDEPQIVEIWF